ncbi:MAG: DUF2752 domain-containing protein [Lachnospiraceae bacterium]|jgi:hypothetical protein|nr:DUF2752 domain-containing protein [Lachnospiraceae bacterium]NBJ83606.1 DUF2752 domain-containing protein [bacterium 1XD42-76]NBK06890.1 DUF2752 domain-containing protein [bacterium 1XD42-94]
MNEAKLWFWLWRNGRIPCLFHEITGLYCPGCGGTRAFKALLRGELLLSVLYHPFVLYGAGLAVWCGCRYLLQKRKQDVSLLPGLGAVYAGAAIIVMNFLVKNYFLIAEGIDILKNLPPM